MDNIKEQAVTELTPEELVTEHVAQEGLQFPVVGIGASAGGLKALAEFFENTPGDSGMAFVVILHLSPNHESNLARVIQASTPMPVVQVNESVPVEPNKVYVISPNHHLSMSDGHITVSDPERPQGRRVPIDLFFRTLAETHGPFSGAVVLSGSGSDGTIGLARIKEYLGVTVAQDPTESDYSEMPRSAIGTGLVDYVLPANQMPRHLISYWANASKIQLPPPEEPMQDVTTLSAEEAVRDVLALLRARTGHDYSQYKRSTILRRIARRMQVRDTERVLDYLNYLREHNEEIPALENDFLISVTNFFRDTAAFSTLAKETIPSLFQGKYASETVRVWVAACASGEEAYSIAMLLREHADTLPQPPDIQIFATDIDADAIGMARDGVYSEAIAADVSPARLARFFIKEQSTYRIKKEIREMVLFATHNLLKDPPFSRLDLVSCRNLLIYLNKNAQAQLLDTFHFALKPDGFLFLGNSETVEGLPKLFLSVNKREHIFERLHASNLGGAISNMPASRNDFRASISRPAVVAQRTPNLAELHRMLLEMHGPPSVLVDQNSDIIHLSHNANMFLQFSPGEPSHNLLKVARPELRMELRSALYAADQSHKAPMRQVQIDIGGEVHCINISASLVQEPEAARGLKLVIFDDIGPVATNDEATSSRETVIVQQLELDLQRTKDQLRLVIEQYETSTEELKASNEELQAINEELRSTSEELETSKEELQAVNEELQTVNQELKLKVEEVTWANNDLQNLLSSTSIATVFLDRELHIKRYTRDVATLFNIIPSDVNRPIEHVTNKLSYPDLTSDAAQVLQRLAPIEREVSSSTGEWYMVQLVPYRTIDDRIDGVVLSFVDITDRKRAQDALQFASSELEKQSRTRTTELLQANITLRTEAVEREQAQIVRQELMRHLVTAQEEERRRISRELHDELGQLLTGLKFMLGTASRKPKTQDVNLAEAQSVVDTVIARIRELAANLRPSVLDDIGLLPALLELVASFATQTEVVVDFQHTGMDRRFPGEIETTVYRIIQEALTNVVRHADVKAARVQIVADGVITLRIEDDGVGFDSEKELNGGPTRGLSGMVERVSLVGGELNIDSSPGKGTRITVVVPTGIAASEQDGGN